MTQKKQPGITLDTPIKHGDKTIDTINLRKPNAGELRGTKLSDVLMMDVSAMIKIIPRVSEPALTEDDLANMDPADFTELALGVVGFLERKNDSR
jgi:hypothetical protein